MTASIITVSGQIGTGAGAIGRGVAEKMHFRYYDWEVTSQAALEAGVSPEILAATAERVPTFIERMMRRLAPSADEVEETPPPGPRPRLSMMSSDDYRQFIEHVVRELAKLGDAVINGHAGQVILRNTPGVLRVLVRGSNERRAERIAVNQGTNAAQARAVIEQSDRQRTEFFRRAYHIDWLDVSQYDLVVSTDFISPELAIDMVVAAAREVP